ncbi:NUDIX domain-containing protein [Parvibaculum sp.]|uniref:NUDIX domain-containing protein n=1 Tax=Parvibaculum sp. TaxID=2024848 RepID=UPI002C7D355F|nr:NUDIX domain-containing protein [Parvibaculum sp.]HUD50846.1 NUDIX domain-containing protein [Parvibaculum sp.]
MKDIACALFVRDGRLLLAKRGPQRSKYPDRWDLPGGHAEARDTLEGALARELGEELGVKPRAASEIAQLPEPHPDVYGAATYHIFLVTEWEGEPEAHDDEHSALRWFEPEEAASLDDLSLPALKNIFLNLPQARGSSRSNRR